MLIIFNYFFQVQKLYLQDPNQTLDVCVSATLTWLMPPKLQKKMFLKQIFDRKTLIKSNSICNVKNNLYILPAAYQIFIKNESHDTIHTFKNYFATVFFSFQFQFSVFSCIQTDQVFDLGLVSKVAGLGRSN